MPKIYVLARLTEILYEFEAAISKKSLEAVFEALWLFNYFENQSVKHSPIAGRNIANGKSDPFSLHTSSATAFVNTYVFG